MQRWLAAAVLFAFLAGLTGLPAHAQTAPSPKTDPKSSKEPTFGKDFVNGKLLSVGDKEITVEFTWKQQVVNKEAADRLAQLQKEYNDAGGIPDAGQRFQRMREIMVEVREKQKVLYSSEMKTDQQKLVLEANVKVRTAKLPEPQL